MFRPLPFALWLLLIGGCAQSAPMTGREPTGPVQGGEQHDADRGRTGNGVEDKSAPPVPVELPPKSARGCVAPDLYAKLVADLEAHAQSSKERALVDQGAVLYQRKGFLLGGLGGGYSDDEGPPLGEPYEVKGKRFVVVGYSEDNDRATVAKRGDSLHLIELKARSNRLALKVCGVNPCIPGRGTMVQQRPVVIPLEEGESFGPPIVLRYDTWWVFAAYEKSQRCQPVP